MAKATVEQIDAAAHTVFEFLPEYAVKFRNCIVYCHEDGLYSVRDTETNIVSLVRAYNPQAAAEKVLRGRTK